MADTYDDYSREELIRELRLRDRRPRFGLVWERKEIEHEKAVNDDFVALDFDPDLSCGDAPYRNLIIEGDNFDALRTLRMTHAGKIKCIYIDPPYTTPATATSSTTTALSTKRMRIGIPNGWNSCTGACNWQGICWPRMMG